MAKGRHRLSELRILMIGKTGHGKSSTGNSILGGRPFEVSNSSTSCTKDAFTQESERFDYTLRVTDTPGLFDTNLSQEKIRRILMKCLFTTIPGIDAILFVLKCGEKFTRELQDTQRLFYDWFGPGVENFSFLVITDCNSSDEARGYVRGRPHDALTELASRCGNRIFPINNRSQSDEIEAHVRFMIDSIVRHKQENGGQSFRDLKCDLVRHIARTKETKEVSLESLRIMESAGRDVKRFFESEGFKVLQNCTSDDDHTSVSPEPLYPVRIIDEATNNECFGYPQIIEESPAQQVNERSFSTASRDCTNDSSLDLQSIPSGLEYQDVTRCISNDSNCAMHEEYSSPFASLPRETDGVNANEHAVDIDRCSFSAERYANETVSNNQRVEGEHLCPDTSQTDYQQHGHCPVPVPDIHFTRNNEISGPTPRAGHSRRNRKFGPNPGIELHSLPVSDHSYQGHGPQRDVLTRDVNQVDETVLNFREKVNTSETFFQATLNRFKALVNRIRHKICSIL